MGSYNKKVEKFDKSVKGRRKMVYRVIIEKGEDFGYVVHCPAIPGCHSQGNTIEEAIENIKDAIIGCLSVLDEDLVSKKKELASIEISV
jgi:predicted RNase H-like HicB family nuclease